MRRVFYGISAVIASYPLFILFIYLKLINLEIIMNILFYLI